MIHINLLPVEKRKSEKTPLPNFMLLVGAATAAVLLVGYILTAFLRLGYIKGEIADQEAILQDLKPELTKYNNLTKEIQALKAKIKQIKTVTERDMDLWESLDNIWAVLHQNKRVWVDEVSLVDSGKMQSLLGRRFSKRAAMPEYAIEMKCHAAGYDPRDITRLRVQLKENEYLKAKFGDMFFIPEWKVDEEEDFQEKFSMEFNIILHPRVKEVPVQRRGGGNRPQNRPGGAKAGFVGP